MEYIEDAIREKIAAEIKLEQQVKAIVANQPVKKDPAKKAPSKKKAVKKTAPKKTTKKK